MEEFAKDLLGILNHKGISLTEAHKYLELYASGEKPYAVIKAGGECIHNDSEFYPFMQDLYLLGRLGIFPTVVYGWGVYLDQKMAEKSMIPIKIDGKRVTSPEVLELIVEIIAETQRKVKIGIRKIVKDISPNNFTVPEINDLSFTKTFEASKKNDDLGLVGEITNVEINHILENSKNNIITMTAPLGYSIEKESLFTPFGIDGLFNINGDTAAIALTKAMKPHKYIFLTQTGGILDYEGNIIKRLNILSNYDIDTGIIKKEGKEIAQAKDGMKVKLDEIVYLLKELGPDASAQIASPKNLLVELLTDRGAGTLIKLGYNIESSNDYDSISTLVNATINSAFKNSDKKLKVNYHPDDSKIYYDDGYQGIAIIKNMIHLDSDFVYLDKFAVIPEAQSNGLGSALLGKAYRDNNKMFWRSSKDNPFNDMYYKFSISHRGGACNVGKWIVYWTNDFPMQLVRSVCLEKDSDFTSLS